MGGGSLKLDSAIGMCTELTGPSVVTGATQLTKYASGL